MATSSKRGKALSDDELVAEMREYISAAVNYSTDHFARHRIYAEKLYQGDKTVLPSPVGRSSIMSRDVAEAVDTMLPGLLKVFAQTDEPCRFLPQKPEDEELAQQATDIVNYYWNIRCNGYQVMRGWFHSGLMFRLGIIKIFWDESDSIKIETYHALDDQQYQLLVQDPEIEMIEEDVYPDPDAMQLMENFLKAQKAQEIITATLNGKQPPDQSEEPPIDPSSLPQLRDCKCKRTKQHKGIKIVLVPPEEFIFNQYATGDEYDRKAKGHRRRMTASELREMGYSEKLIDDIEFEPSRAGYQQEKFTRHKKELGLKADTNSYDDPAENTTYVTEMYLYIDFDGDGVAEYRKVTLAGEAGNVILENEIVDDHPFAFVTMPLPHKLVGTSLVDQTEDLQLWKSTVMRMVNDNYYLTAHTRYAVDKTVNQDDLLNPKPGSPIRISATGPVSDHILPLTINPVAAQTGLQLIEYIDSVRENRTGVTRHGAGLNPDILKSHQSAGAVQSMMDASTERMELIARDYGEGLKRAFRRILDLIIKHAPKEEVLRLRGKWIPFRPADFHTNFDLVCQVGLGNGDRDSELQRAMSLMPIMAQVIQMQGGPTGPLITPANIYNMLMDIIRTAGFRNPDLYVSDPKTQPPQQPKPPQPDPIDQGKLQLAGAQLAEKKREFDAKHQLATQKATSELSLQQQKLTQQSTAQTREQELQALKIHHQGMAEQADRELDALQLAHSSANSHMDRESDALALHHQNMRPNGAQ